MSSNKQRKHEKQVMPVIPSTDPLWCWQSSFQDLHRQLLFLAGWLTLGWATSDRDLCPGVTHTGSQMSCLGWRRRTLPWGRVSRWCKGLLPCSSFPRLYCPEWKEKGTSGKNTVPVLIKEVKPYILMSMAMSYVHLNQPYTQSLILRDLKPGLTHDMTAHPREDRFLKQPWAQWDPLQKLSYLSFHLHP